MKKLKIKPRKTLSRMKMINYIKNFWKALKQPLFALCGLVLVMLACCACGTLRKCEQIGYSTTENVIYRDSTIVRTDTIKVEIPRERIVEVLPMLDTLQLETSVAQATAYLDTTSRMLRGSIENKRTSLTREIEYHDRLITRDSLVVKEVPVEKIVKEPYVPLFFKISTFIGILSIIGIGIYLYFKLR